MKDYVIVLIAAIIAIIASCTTLDEGDPSGTSTVDALAVQYIVWSDDNASDEERQRAKSKAVALLTEFAGSGREPSAFGRDFASGVIERDPSLVHLEEVIALAYDEAREVTGHASPRLVETFLRYADAWKAAETDAERAGIVDEALADLSGFNFDAVTPSLASVVAVEALAADHEELRPHVIRIARLVTLAANTGFR